MNIIDILSTGIEQGIIWAILVIGVYITYRILDIADLSVEGTFPLGACTAALMIYLGVNPVIACIISMITGMIAGAVTGLLHTSLKIPSIISGIIVMTALTSVNLVILGFANENSSVQSVLNIDKNIFQAFSELLTNSFKIPLLYSSKISSIIIGLIFLLLISILIYWLFGTEIGMSIRTTGNNPKMARAQGINTNLMIIFGLMLSNGLIALSGALYAQNSGTAIADCGRGAIIIGLASIIIGEIIFKHKTFKSSLIAIIIGTIIFFIIKQIAIRMNVEHYLNLFTAILITVILAMPVIKSKLINKKKVENHA